jgi:hypothetical protein
MACPSTDLCSDLSIWICIYKLALYLRKVSGAVRVASMLSEMSFTGSAFPAARVYWNWYGARATTTVVRNEALARPNS